MCLKYLLSLVGYLVTTHKNVSNNNYVYIYTVGKTDQQIYTKSRYIYVHLTRVIATNETNILCEINFLYTIFFLKCKEKFVTSFKFLLYLRAIEHTIIGRSFIYFYRILVITLLI
jgi:hypothetical protein